MFLHKIKFSLFGRLLFCFFFSIVTLNVFVRCDDRALFLNLFNATLKNFEYVQNQFGLSPAFLFRLFFYPIVESFVLRKQKGNKLPTTTITTTRCSIGLDTTGEYKTLAC